MSNEVILSDFPAFHSGIVAVWYMKREYFRDGTMGYDFCKEHDLLPDPNNLHDTHAYLGGIDESDKDEAWRKLQGEFWSPEGEARDFIQMLGLSHTSMSVGDIFEIRGEVFMVDNCGFAKLN